MTAAQPEAAAGPAAAPVRGARIALRWLRPGREAVALFLVALGVRLVGWLLRPAIPNDSADLLASAEAVRAHGAGALLDGWQHPLPVIVSSAGAGAPDPEAIASVLAVVAASAAVFPLHALARSAGGRHAATMACLLYAVLPRFVSTSTAPLSEPYLLPCLAAALAMALVSGAGLTRRDRLARAAAAGAFAGLALLARPEGAIGAAAVAAMLAARGRRGERIASVAIAAGAFVLVAGPWIAALSADRGRLVLSPKKEIADFLGTGAAPKDAEGTASLTLGVRGLAAALWSALGGALALVLIGAFPIRRWRRHRSSRPRAVLLVTAAVLCALLVRLSGGWGYASGRHALAAALLLLPFAGEGMVALVGFFGRARHRRRAALLLGFAVTIPTAVVAVLRPDGEDGVGARILGEQIARAERTSGTSGDVVIASFREPLVAYYCDRDLRPAGRRARDVRLFRRFKDLLVLHADRAGLRAELAAALRDAGASWLVLEFWRAPPDGSSRHPGEDLAAALVADGVLRGPVEGSGELVAYPVVR